MIEEYFIKLSQGDVRSIIIALFICFIAFIILKALVAIFQKGKGYFKVLFFAFGILLLYGIIYFPHSVQAWSLTIVDWLTAIIENLFNIPDSTAHKN